ncbi:hypothetical protein QBC47DRAFT_397473 [Echria macrotheca]|uniref:Uncharacterized protein n=1 Tax=Echria macrotheca TaxID=438768 RepID=A0AAJ0BQY6_9PEZI|nr:hypothetical protein QBC47DRAFT_397473 [Echria macrotheca]
MYKTNNFGWKLTHMLCILAHLGLIVGGAIAYVYNKMSRDTAMVEWARLGGINTGRAAPCSRDLQLVLGSEMAMSAPLDVALHTLPLCCLALGALGLAVNTTLFVVLLGAETVDANLTEGEQHWRKQVVTFFSCISNLLLAGAGVALAGALGMKLLGSKSLITPLVWASVQVPLSLITASFDVIKNHRDGKDLLD